MVLNWLSEKALSLETRGRLRLRHTDVGEQLGDGLAAHRGAPAASPRIELHAPVVGHSQSSSSVESRNLHRGVPAPELDGGRGKHGYLGVLGLLATP